jgi:hypothetical protein
MSKFKILLPLYFLIISCGALGDAGKVLRNEKVRTTDEFLVEKRNPLVLPPNFEEIPKPGSMTEEKKNNENNIKKILKSPQIKKETSKNSSIEQSILKDIRK